MKIITRISYLVKFTLIALTLFGHYSYGQTSGRFNRYVPVPSEPNRRLSYYVPVSYNPANKYKLIIALHGLGDNSVNYRNFLASDSIYTGDTNIVTDPHSPAYNAIVVAPEAGNNVNTDYWTPVSDTCIITLAIADAMSAYNIDPHYIYLNGFSLGGRSALRYGLLNYNRFRALLLWTPAIQSVNEANNLTSFTYVWQNGKYIPIYISVGTTDGFLPILKAAYQNLYSDQALVKFQVIYGMGHEPPPLVNQLYGMQYIEQHADSYFSNDAGISSITSPHSEECSTAIMPIVYIQNKGLNNLTSATIKYQIDNSAVYTSNWTGNLIQLGTSGITLPTEVTTIGLHTFKAYTTVPNGVTDSNPANDTDIVSFSTLANGISSNSVPVQGFEGSVFLPADWSLSGSDMAWGWEQEVNDTSGSWSLFQNGPSGANGQSSSCIYFDNFFVNNTGKHYSIRTPEYDFTNAVEPALTYDYAYAPGVSGGNQYNDTLLVSYSTDCGINWTALLKRGGISLSTTGGWDSNVFVPAANQWAWQGIDLAAVIGQPKVMFSFENISGWGNMMYLDNINVNAVQGIATTTQSRGACKVYPNPSNGIFHIDYQAYSNTSNELKIMDVMGREAYSTILAGNQGVQDINTAFLSEGIYYWEVLANDQVVDQGKMAIIK